MRAAAAALALTLAGCSNQVAVTGWPFDPVQFFTGHTTGRAVLHVVTGASHLVLVDGRGTSDGRGGLTLVQKIDQQGSAPRTRTWVLHRDGANRWTGTLTDADGPVVVERTPEDVTIRYHMHGGAKVEQHLQLPPGGVADNHLTVKRFGVRIAWLDERIRKAGP